MSTIDLVSFAIAIVISFAGLAAIVGHVLRPRPKDRLLLWFGLFSEIYGVRMFFKQTLATALGIDKTTGLWVETVFTYLILVPGLLFTEELYGLGWRRSLRWLTNLTALYAVAAVVVDAAASPLRAPDPSLAVLALFIVVVIAGALSGYEPPPFRESGILIAGFVAFMLLVLNDHAVGARTVPWRVTAEPIGFLIQLGCFGYVTLLRVFAQGRQLIAIDHEMRSAREIQESILPRNLPPIGGLRIAARYLPLAVVAGDLYDIVPLEGDGIALLVADVSGHGVSAALIASMVKVAFAAALRETTDPGGILERMNGALCGMFERSYVTAACTLLRPGAGALTYSLAGHPSPLMHSDGNSIVALDERGIFLGVMPDATYPTATVSIASGARLIVYTDGVTETSAPGDELFGIERLSAFAAEQRHRSGEEFADALMQTLHRFQGRAGPAHDDVTLVVVDVA